MSTPLRPVNQCVQPIHGGLRRTRPPPPRRTRDHRTPHHPGSVRRTVGPVLGIGSTVHPSVTIRGRAGPPHLFIACGCCPLCGPPDVRDRPVWLERSAACLDWDMPIGLSVPTSVGRQYEQKPLVQRRQVISRCSRAYRWRRAVRLIFAGCVSRVERGLRLLVVVATRSWRCSHHRIPDRRRMGPVRPSGSPSIVASGRNQRARATLGYHRAFLAGSERLPARVQTSWVRCPARTRATVTPRGAVPRA